jgi:NAD(P)H-dependent FMN reductase
MKHKILTINGSAQEPSINDRYLNFIESIIEQNREFEFKRANIRTLRLPLFLGYETSRGLAVEKWREMMDWADGYILASPEYDHALPAALKNAFEHLDGTDVMKEKPVFLLGCSTGQFGTLQAQHSLYPIFRTYKMWLMPDEMFIPRADQKIDGHDRITDETLAKRVSDLTAKFQETIKLFNKKT